MNLKPNQWMICGSSTFWFFILSSFKQAWITTLSINEPDGHLIRIQYYVIGQ